MLNPWFSAMLLAFEANDVVRLRMFKMASGGQGALEEAQLMVAEKVGASFEAFKSVMGGGTPISVIERYRELVAANASRLSR